MRIQKLNTRRLRFAITTVLLVSCLTYFRGCSVVSGYDQIVRVSITDTANDVAVGNAEIYRIDESNLGVDGRVFVSDEDGFADIIVPTYVPCGFSFGPDSCRSRDYEDTVTGSMGKFLIDDGEVDDIVELELQVGNDEIGSVYSIEVIAISKPFDLNSR